MAGEMTGGMPGGTTRGTTPRWRLGPIAASTLAGFFCAALVDLFVTTARSSGGGGAMASLLVLALGLYGLTGLITGVLSGWLVAGVLRAASPAASSSSSSSSSASVRWSGDERRDGQAATGLLAGAAGVALLAALMAAAHQVVVRPMQSEKLATIAVAGLVLMAAPLAAAVAITLFPGLARWVTPRVPRLGRSGRTGFLLITAGIAGVLAAAAAFSRADWRVLDLSPFVALAVAVAAALGHALFWYRSAPGRRLGRAIPAGVASGLAIVLVFGAVVASARLSDTNPAFRAAEEGSLGLRMGLRVARAATDGDKDGFSASFGGGDCDDRRAEVYPGAEDVPGNQLDENCEGGDAAVVADSVAAADVSPPGPAGAESGDAAQVTAQGAPESNSRAAQAPPGAAFGGNILLVTIDALRADRLGVAGYRASNGRSLTPNLDALTKRGAYFKRVWSQAPNTPRSFPAILTSQVPSAVKWDKPAVNYPVVLPSNHTFFEDLQRAGFTNIGIFSHFYFTTDRGINKAFKEWSNDGAGTIAESNKDTASPRMVPRVLARLKKAAAAKERFALWTHLFEPHSSYMAHKEFPSSGVGGVAGLMEKYDNEIAFVDMWVGKLLKGLEELGLAGNTTVVVMADHGEAWGEHKSYFHGQDLFEEQLRIPLIIAVPGRPPLVNDDPVAAVDLAPTLVELIGAPLPASFRGRSLMPALAGKSMPPRPVYAELMPATAWPHHAVMMVEGGKKLIHRISARRWELYDLQRDRGEKRNLAEDPGHRAEFERLRAMLLAFEERKR